MTGPMELMALWYAMQERNEVVTLKIIKPLVFTDSRKAVEVLFTQIEQELTIEALEINTREREKFVKL